MKSSNMRSRTIQFYEVVKASAAQQVRMEQQAWPAVMSHLAKADLGTRTWQSDRAIIGQTYPVDEVDRLLLHRMRDAGDWLSRVDFATSEIKAIEAEAGTGYLDSSAIHFVEFGNIVALMQGSTAAPGHKTLEGWLNHLRPFKLADDEFLAVRPLVTPGELDRLEAASQVSRFEIKLGRHLGDALKGKTGNLARFLRRSSKFGDVDVTVVISVPRGKQRTPDRVALAQELQELQDVLPAAAQAAQATLYFGPADAISAGRVTELLEHHITAKRNVRAVDEEGNSIRFNGAFTVIDTVIYELADQLRSAADVSSGAG